MDTTDTHKSIGEIIAAAARAGGGLEPAFFQRKHLSKMSNLFKQCAMYLAREQGHSFHEIAKAFGLKAHGSAAYAHRQIKVNLTDPTTRGVLTRVRQELKG